VYSQDLSKVLRLYKYGAHSDESRYDATGTERLHFDPSWEDLKILGRTGRLKSPLRFVSVSESLTQCKRRGKVEIEKLRMKVAAKEREDKVEK